jgi:hypothetical protein
MLASGRLVSTSRNGLARSSGACQLIQQAPAPHLAIRHALQGRAE